MARLESVAIGGYYPTPPNLIPAIASRIGVRPDTRYAFMDPCAGDGEALFSLVDEVCPRPDSERGSRGWGAPDKGPTVYAVEMEATRHEKLETNGSSKWYGPVKVIHSDAFCVSFDLTDHRYGVGCLYLNPPYDTHPKFKRLEEKFLQRFTPALATGGVLVFVIPNYALAASARTLGIWYTDISCFRFPDPEWDAYSQVVLYARKRHSALLDPDPIVVDQVTLWSREADSIPAWGHNIGTKVVSLPDPRVDPKRDSFSRDMQGLSDFEVIPVDLPAVLEAYVPWSMTDRRGKAVPIPGVMVDPLSDDLSVRMYPTLMPPRPAHIAAGIASGVFNGERIIPDDESSGAPPLLVKGVFDREYETVEEKKDRDGTVTAEVQVQQPRLVVTVLDLRTSQLHTMQSSVVVTGSVDPANMTTGDLLTVYGRSLLATLKAHCPVLHDPGNPAHNFDLPVLARPLFRAQASAVRAMVKSLGGPGVSMKRRRKKAVVLLGEIGSGKTSVATATAMACGAQRILAMCPPHLLDSWVDEINAVNPPAEVMVLRDVDDIRKFHDLKHEGLAIALLSRETAKLGHAYEGVGPVCSKCGALQSSTKEEQVRGRLRCEHAVRTPINQAAMYVECLAPRALSYFPDNPILVRVARQRMSRRVLEKILPRYIQRRVGENKVRDPLSAEEMQTLRTRPWVQGLLRKVLGLMADNVHQMGWQWKDHPLVKCLRHLLSFYGDDRLFAATAEMMFVGAALGDGFTGTTTLQQIALVLLRHMTPRSDLLKATLEKFREWSKGKQDYSTHGVGPGEIRGAREGLEAIASNDEYCGLADGGITRTAGMMCYANLPMGNVNHLNEALNNLYSAGSWAEASAPCNEVLFQAIPDPVRYPLATYITRKFPGMFDFLILDEAHELGNDGSAQERAAHRLTGIGCPTILMTGSVMNGYAKSLFANWWSLFPDFKQEFGRHGLRPFVDRFGYRKRQVQDVDRTTGKVIEFGSRSDRVDRKEKDLGDAPGLLPLFILQFLLPHAATLQKADLQLDLPPCLEIPVKVKPTQEQNSRHMTMLQTLMDRVKADAFTPMMGKLWGQVAESPSQLDRATQDVGNNPDGTYVVKYPDSVGGEIVHTVSPFDPDFILPKEQWILDTMAREFSEGRNVLLFTWHTELLPRMQKLIQARFGFKTPILDPAKVPTGKRQAWINTNVVSKNARVLLANPVCVQTGLNNLVHFSTQIWMENPACNPIIFRQARGRVDRIGQKAHETRIYFPIYDSVAAAKLHSLLLYKVGVSMATDGLDADSALQAAGVGESGSVTGFSVGKELYKLLQEMW